MINEIEKKIKNKVCLTNINAFNNLQNYDKISYSEIVHENLVKTILNVINKRDGLNIIDVGCGTGTETKIFFDNTKTSNIYGIDVSKKMLDLLKKRFFSSRVKLINKDAVDYFKNTKVMFDIIFISGALHHIYDYLDLIRYCTMRLNVGGVLILRGDYMKKGSYNFYLSEVARHIDVGYFYFHGIKRWFFILGSPFVFLLPILNKFNIKDKLLWNTKREEKDFCEYWGCNTGIDQDKVIRLLRENNIHFDNYKASIGKSGFTKKFLKFFNVKNELNLVGVKLR